MIRPRDVLIIFACAWTATVLTVASAITSPLGERVLRAYGAYLQEIVR